MLSKPVDPADDYMEYLPTQYLAEYIKNTWDSDGLKFSSSLGVGNNYVLFGQDKVEFLDVKLYQVEEIQYKFSEHKN